MTVRADPGLLRPGRALLRPGRALLPQILAAALLAAIGCKDRASSSPGEKTEILVGATLPLTGAESRLGGFYKEGYELAFAEVKKRGGLDVGGKRLPVTLKLIDDTTNQATAVSLADRLINRDHVDFLLGTYSTHLVQGQSTVAEQNRVPYVNGGGAASEIYRRGYKYIFGALAPVELLGTTLMLWIDEQQKAGLLPRPATIALLWENTAHGKDFQKGISDFVAKSGGAYRILINESFELNGKDFSAVLGKVKSANVDMLLADAHLPDYITMHRQYVNAGLCHKIVSYGARGSEKAAVEALGRENVSYILSGVWWSPLLADRIPLAGKFVESFKSMYGRPPEWFQALGYEAARVLFVAIEQAGSVDREKVRAALERMKIESILPGGTVEFPAETGRQSQNWFLVQQNQPDGTSPIVFPKEVASSAGVAVNPRCAK